MTGELLVVETFLEALGQFVVVRLQLVMELDEEHTLLEVLHEFLVVDSAITVNISEQVQSKRLLLRQVQFFERLEALLVLLPL